MSSAEGFRICLISCHPTFVFVSFAPSDSQNLQKQFQNLQYFRWRTKSYCTIEEFFVYLQHNKN